MKFEDLVISGGGVHTFPCGQAAFTTMHYYVKRRDSPIKFLPDDVRCSPKLTFQYIIDKYPHLVSNLYTLLYVG